MISECADDGHCSPIIQCTKEVEELLTAGKLLNKFWIQVTQPQKDIRQQKFVINLKNYILLSICEV